MKNSIPDSLEITVIVSTYNRPDALNLVLCALGEQDFPEFEIVIADDGSDETTAVMVRQHETSRRRVVRHLWQPDEGFRKAEMHNKAILKAAGAYIVFLDGDCVPRCNFLSRHAALAQKGRFVTGGRIRLSQGYTNKVLESRVELQRLTLKDWTWMCLTRRANRFLDFYFLPDGPWRHYRPKSSRRLYGCNMAAWTEDLKVVGGFDERYQGWGSEDRDLVARLINAGIYRKDGRYATSVMHLWHQHADRSRKSLNRRLLQEVVDSGARRAVKGLDQHIGRCGEYRPQAGSSGNW